MDAIALKNINNKENNMKNDYLRKIYQLSMFILVLLIFCNNLYASNGKKWMFGLEYGRAATHSMSFNGDYWSIISYRIITNDNSKILKFGIMHGEQPFLAIYAGYKHLFYPKRKLSPFLSISILLYAEEEWIGLAFNGGLGLDFNISEKFIISPEFKLGGHGSRQGPHIISINFSIPF